MIKNGELALFKERHAEVREALEHMHDQRKHLLESVEPSHLAHIHMIDDVEAAWQVRCGKWLLYVACVRTCERAGEFCAKGLTRRLCTLSDDVARTGVPASRIQQRALAQ